MLKRKGVISVLSAILMLMLSTVTALAIEPYNNSETGYEAIILDASCYMTEAEQVALMNGYMGKLTEITNVIFASTYRNPMGHSEDSDTAAEYSYDYCKYLYDTYYHNNENCLLVLVDDDNGWVVSDWYGEIEDKINNYNGKLVSDTAMDYLNDGDALSFAQTVCYNFYIALGGEGKVSVEILEYTDAGTGYSAYIMDDAMLMSLADKEMLLEDRLKPLLAYSNVVLKTINYNTCGKSDYSNEYEMEYCSKLYDKLFTKTAGGEYENAVIFLIDMDTRWLYVYREGAIKNELTENNCDIITDNIYIYASDKDYTTCSSRCFEQILKVMEGKKIEAPMKLVCNVFIALGLGFIITYIYAAIVSKSHKAGTDAMMADVVKDFEVKDVIVNYRYTSKVYVPPSSSSGGGGGHSGGGGGGGSHGGGGGHRF